MRAEPVQRLPDDRRRGLGHHVSVGPRSDRQPDGHVAVAQPGELGQRLFEEKVLPTGQQQHRNVGALQGLSQMQPRPELVVGVGVLEPGLEPQRTVTEQRAARFPQWQSIGSACHTALRPRLAQQRQQPIGILLVRDQVAPTEEVVEAERPRAPSWPADVVRADGDHSRLHLGWGIAEQRPLGEAQIRQPDSAERAGEPGLFAQPRDGVGAVGNLVHHGRELAARTERAPHALHHHVIAAGGVDRAEQCGEREAAPVGATHQQRAGGGGELRLVVVGDQVHAVAHGNTKAAVDGHLGPG